MIKRLAKMRNKKQEILKPQKYKGKLLQPEDMGTWSLLQYVKWSSKMITWYKYIGNNLDYCMLEADLKPYLEELANRQEITIIQ